MRRLLGRCASSSITFYEVPEGPHELFLGSDSELVTEYVKDWIQQQLNGDLVQDVTDSPLKKAASLVSLTGNPFEWKPSGSSPYSSVYGKLTLSLV